MRRYCDECGKEVETKVVTQKECYDVCGEQIEVDAQVLVCADCGEELFCEELDSATLVSAYNEYRRRHKLLLPEKLENNAEYRAERVFFKKIFSKVPCEENGFKGFDYEKLCAMVLFFAHKSPELLKTKLMKLLNYSDMIYYKENGVSMSGLRYAHLPYGPVPENFDILFGRMSIDNIAHIEVIYENGYEKHQVIPEKAIPDNILSAEELEVLDRIYDKFKDFGSVEISNYSHKEKGYSATKQGEIISYSYAKNIQLN
mgnify:CR=1 FL=1